MSRSFIFFVAGTVVGGFTGYYICKKKYNIVKTEEVKEAEPKVDKVKAKEDYEETVYKASYKKEEKDADDEWDEAEKVNPVEPDMVPYQISPEAFANEHMDYAKLTMVYYEDNEVLVDEEEECVDIDSTIGYDAINHFGEYEKDAVFIRNEALGNDYEVLLEHASFGVTEGE